MTMEPLSQRIDCTISPVTITDPSLLSSTSLLCTTLPDDFPKLDGIDITECRYIYFLTTNDLLTVDNDRITEALEHCFPEQVTPTQNDCHQPSSNVIMLCENDKETRSHIDDVVPMEEVNRSTTDDDHTDDESDEHDLTNLSWLTEMKNLPSWPDTTDPTTQPTVPVKDRSAIRPTSAIISDIDCQPMTVDRSELPKERFKKFIEQVKQNQINYNDREQMYRTDVQEKPPFNYAQIIGMAMMDKGRMTLKEICRWIEEKFAFFRSNKNWNNSIRHNLSLNFCFTKVARDKTERGKGGYWTLSMNLAKSEKKRIRHRKKRHGTDGGGKVARPRSNRSMNSERSVPIDDRTDLAVQNLLTAEQNVMLTHIVVDSSEADIDNRLNDVFPTDLNTNCLDYESSSSAINDCCNEIFLASDIPLSGDCITIPYLTSQSPNAPTPETPSPDKCSGPNVIVESIPYFVSPIDTVIDIEREFNCLTSMANGSDCFVDGNRSPGLIDEQFFDYGNW